MEDVFLRDLDNATEVVLSDQRVTRPAPPAPSGFRRRRPRARTGRTRRAAAAGALRAGRTFGAALTARRGLGAAEAVTLIWGIVFLAALGFVGLRWPKGLAYPLAVLLDLAFDQLDAAGDQALAAAAAAAHGAQEGRRRDARRRRVTRRARNEPAL